MVVCGSPRPAFAHTSVRKIIQFEPAFAHHALLRFKGLAYSSDNTVLPMTLGEVNLPCLIDGDFLYTDRMALENLLLAELKEQWQVQGQTLESLEFEDSVLAQYIENVLCASFSVWRLLSGSERSNLLLSTPRMVGLGICLLRDLRVAIGGGDRRIGYTTSSSWMDSYTKMSLEEAVRRLEVAHSTIDQLLQKHEGYLSARMHSSQYRGLSDALIFGHVASLLSLNPKHSQFSHTSLKESYPSLLSHFEVIAKSYFREPCNLPLSMWHIWAEATYSLCKNSFLGGSQCDHLKQLLLPSLEKAPQAIQDPSLSHTNTTTTNTSNTSSSSSSTIPRTGISDSVSMNMSMSPSRLHFTSRRKASSLAQSHPDPTPTPSATPTPTVTPTTTSTTSTLTHHHHNHHNSNNYHYQGVFPYTRILNMEPRWMTIRLSASLSLGKWISKFFHIFTTSSSSSSSSSTTSSSSSSLIVSNDNNNNKKSSSASIKDLEDSIDVGGDLDCSDDIETNQGGQDEEGGGEVEGEGEAEGYGEGEEGGGDDNLDVSFENIYEQNHITSGEDMIESQTIVWNDKPLINDDVKIEPSSSTLALNSRTVERERFFISVDATFFILSVAASFGIYAFQTSRR